MTAAEGQGAGHAKACDCDSCRVVDGILALLGRRGLGARTEEKHLAQVLDRASQQIEVVAATASEVEASVRSLVQLKRGYEVSLRSLPEDKRSGNDYYLKLGTVNGLQISIDKIAKAIGLKVDDPAPPREKRATKKRSDLLDDVPVDLIESATKESTTDRKLSPSFASLSVAEKRILMTAKGRRFAKLSSTSLQLAIHSLYSPTSGSFLESVRSLRDRGFLEDVGDGSIRSTDIGGRLVADAIVPSPATLLAAWQAKLGATKAKILGVCVRLSKSTKGPLTLAAIAESTGYSQTSGSFLESVRKLRALRLIDADLRASREFAP